MPTTTPRPNGQEASAADAGLVYVNGGEPGIRRIGSPGDFAYRDSDGKPISDEATLDRIRQLAIPPAYTDVWICANPRGHLQATGRDARGRKQHRYHPLWRHLRDSGKFERVAAFAQALPKLRLAVRQDLRRTGLPRDKVLATVVALLAQTLIRVGNQEYARANRSFGLTTLKNRHLARSNGRMAFRFRGKSGKEHQVPIGDARLARIVRRCQQLPGQQLFQYVDEDGTARTLDSGMVNDYLRDRMGESFTAKDFRTWGGTLAAMVILAQIPFPEAGDDATAFERRLAQSEKAAVTQVAALLGNTPKVCRKSYVHPDVFAAWRDGSLARALPLRILNPAVSLSRLEHRALALLKRRMRSARRS